jgi:hypothetical protein
METQMCNMECNACAAAMLTHHFVKQMLDRQLKGAVVFTSSAAAMMPAPFSVMYGSTKVRPPPPSPTFSLCSPSAHKQFASPVDGPWEQTR